MNKREVRVLRRQAVRQIGDVLVVGLMAVTVLASVFLLANFTLWLVAVMRIGGL